MRLVVRFPTHRVLSCLGHYWWWQTRKWAHFAVKFPFAACFWYKNFWNIGENVNFFGPNSPKLGSASGYRVTFRVRRKKSQKILEGSEAPYAHACVHAYVGHKTVHAHLKRMPTP